MKDPEVLKAVDSQTDQWTTMMKKHRKEEWEMLKTHLKAQEDIYKKVAETVQAKQIKEMEAFFAKYEYWTSLGFWLIGNWKEKEKNATWIMF